MSPPFVLLPRLPRYLSQDEIRAFFRAVTGLRDQTLFALIYHHGLRVGEVALLRRGNVDLSRRRIIVLRLKRGAWAAQTLFSSTAILLGRYLATIPADPEGPLFPGHIGPLRKRQIQSLFACYRDRAGLSARFSCHSLRHSIATHLLDAGVSLEFVQDHLGHQSIRSTSIYARITDHRREAVFRELESSPWVVQPGRRDPDPVSHLPKGRSVTHDEQVRWQSRKFG